MINIPLVTQEHCAQIYSLINEHCEAIYFGGSRVDPVIDNAKDFDFICFAKQYKRTILRNLLNKLGCRTAGSIKINAKKLSSTVEYQHDHEDFSQIRHYPYNKITWFSYLDTLMVKIVGKDVCPKTDIINTHRKEFLADLREKADWLITDLMKNKKRWYHILRGVYILINNSYEVTEEQHKEINILHDLSEGWEEIKDKTIKLLTNLK